MRVSTHFHGRRPSVHIFYAHASVRNSLHISVLHMERRPANFHSFRSSSKPPAPSETAKGFEPAAFKGLGIFSKSLKTRTHQFSKGVKNWQFPKAARDFPSRSLISFRERERAFEFETSCSFGDCKRRQASVAGTEERSSDEPEHVSVLCMRMATGEFPFVPRETVRVQNLLLPVQNLLL